MSRLSPEDDVALAPPGPYDRDPDAGEAAWFLPAPLGHEAPFHFVAVTGAPGGAASDVKLQAWRTAEAALAAELAALAFDAGRLAERIDGIPGALAHLALLEAASLSWWAGDRVTGERIALWLALRQGAAGEDAAGVARAGWAARRLMDHAARDVAGQLGPVDEAAADRAALAEVLEAAADLTAVARGCLAFTLWRALPGAGAGQGATGSAAAREIAAAVLGARLAAGRGGGLAFLPLTLAGFAAVTASGPPERRLRAWATGAHQAVLSALMALGRVRAWQGRALEATADLSGRTPARLIGCVARHPLVTAPLAEAETGASRAAVQRNLDTLAARGLVREVTGQGRYRMWAAAL